MIRKGVKSFLSYLFVLIFTLLLISGCSAKNQHDAGSSSQVSDASAPSESPSSIELTQTSKSLDNSTAQYDDSTAQVESLDYERKIIKQATIEQKVTELGPAIKQVQLLVDQAKGYFQSSTVKEYNTQERIASYVLRVPSNQYLAVITQIQSIGKNTTLSEKGDDVTEEYYDNEARIKNLKLQEEAVQKLFDKATLMEDILKIQQELFRIRGEIEQYEGRNRYIDNLTSMSTIELTIREVKPVEYVSEHSDSAWQRAREGFIDTLGGLSSFFVDLFVYLISALPFIIMIFLPIAILIWGIVRWSRLKELQANSHSIQHESEEKKADI